MQIGRVLGIVEEHQLSGALVDLGVRREAVERYPGLDAKLLERFGIEAIAFATLIEGRERFSGMHHDVGARRILEIAVRAEARAFGEMDGIGKPTPQRTARFLLRRKAARAHEAVAIGGAAAVKIDLVDHRVAVEGMETAERLVDLIFGVAQIDT